MLKKLCTLITSTLLCLTLSTPIAAKAAMFPNEGMTHECTGSSQEKKNASEELSEKWNTLSAKQKADIYKSLKSTVDAQGRFLDKLVKYELMTKEDAEMLKDEMVKRFNEMKENNVLFNAKPKEKNGPNKEQNSSQQAPVRDTVNPE